MRRALPLLALAVALVGCERSRPDRLQGYIEGEFVYVASPDGASLRELFVDRGTAVKTGDPLYALDDGATLATRNEAARRVAQAEANLADTRQGQRPTEIGSIEAQLQQTEAGLTLSQKEFERQTKLGRSGVSAARDVDQARAARDQDLHHVEQLRANLATARLGSRDAQIDAASENLRAQRAALAGAEWTLAQMRRVAPEPALVFDVLYRPGDWVAAGRPVVVLLPPRNVKARTFVPQAMLGRLHPGDPANVFLDGGAGPVTGRISYLSPQAEYTPPVIYSQEMRAKFVFLVEITFDPADAARLHPGQPVDIAFAAP